MSKPIALYANGPSPNPKKVAIVLEELGVPYEIITTPYTEVKQEPFLSLNPNGRLPAIKDPNTGITLFESGAIIEYLVDKYDKEDKLQYTTEPEKYLTQSWLHFQMSGQGPYFGQLAWFKLFHSEKNITSAIDRYANEVKRVVGVIDAHLKKQQTKYVVGDRITYADLAFTVWFDMIHNWLLTSADFDYKTEHPTYAAWIDGLLSRESVKTVLAKAEFQKH